MTAAFDRPAEATREEWDAARRLADTVKNALYVDRAGAAFRWIAVNLATGASDGTLYDSREDAARCQLHAQYYTYVVIRPNGMTPRVAWRFLLVAREVQRTHHTSFATEGRHVILPARAELAAAIAPRAFRRT